WSAWRTGAVGLMGDSLGDPIHTPPPRKRMTRMGMPQTTIARVRKKRRGGGYRARRLDARNHQPKARIATIVGTTITSMIPSALSRIFAFAAPIGPCGSSTLPEQPLTERRRISAADVRQGRGCRFKSNAAHDDMVSGGR